MQIRPFSPADRAAVIDLWRSAGLLRPWNDPDRDIDRKLVMQADGFLVAERDGAIVGAVMTGYDGHRGWVNYLASEPGERHTGIGRALMQAAEEWLLAQGCPKLNLQVRADNVSAMAFYERLGYGRDRTASYGKRLIDDDDGAPVSTPEPRQLVLASRNAKKARELEAMLAPLGWQVLPVSQFSDVEPEETGLTFVENALIKARHACRVSGLPAIADDSGLEVAALGGAPGVRSARFAGGHGDDAANNALLLERLAGLPEAQRGARFVSLLVCLRHAEDSVPLIAEGFWNGRILEAPRGEGGFGYDPLFYVPDHACASAELSAETKNRISHRARAMARLLDQLSAWA